MRIFGWSVNFDSTENGAAIDLSQAPALEHSDEFQFPWSQSAQQVILCCGN
jgi:hypothetical protein